MVCSLTELLKTYPENNAVITNWVEGVFPLILDVEQKAADKVQEVNTYYLIYWNPAIFYNFTNINVLHIHFDLLLSNYKEYLAVPLRQFGQTF